MSTLHLQPGAEPVRGYKLIGKLGRGGFGEVWKALAPGGFPVALKFVPLAGPAGEAELRSLKILRTVHHPNLVSIFGAWSKDQTLIIAMELGDRTLGNRFEEAVGQGLAGIPRPELLEYMVEIAKAIDYLNSFQHDLDGKEQGGIQHRDIKPGNILLVGGGVKVADFGLARFLERAQTGHTGSLTLDYAAPEFFNGQTSQWSDQYSLAVTYCHVRGGRPPFSGSAAQVTAGHLLQPPDLTMLPPEERGPVQRALAKEPAQRWPNCRALVEALSQCSRTAARPAATVPPRSGLAAPTRPPVPAAPPVSRPPVTDPNVGARRGFTLLVDDPIPAPAPTRPRAPGPGPLGFTILAEETTPAAPPARPVNAHPLQSAFPSAAPPASAHPVHPAFPPAASAPIQFYDDPREDQPASPGVPPAVWWLLLGGLGVLLLGGALFLFSLMRDPSNKKERGEVANQDRGANRNDPSDAGRKDSPPKKEDLPPARDSGKKKDDGRQPVQAPPWQLGWKEGDRFYLETICEVKGTIRLVTRGIAQELKETVSYTRTFVFGFTVQKLRADGSVLLEQTVESVRLEAKTSKNNVPEAANSLQGLKGAVLQVTLSPTRETAQLDGYDQLLRRLGAEDQKGVNFLWGESVFREALLEAVAFLPGKPVQPGNSWQRKVLLAGDPLMGDLEVDKTYTAEGPKPLGGRQLEKISFTGKTSYLARKKGIDMPLEIGATNLQFDTVKGEVYFDATAGRLVQSETSWHVKGSLTMKDKLQGGAKNFEVTIDLDGDRSLKVRRFDQNPLQGR